MPSVRKTYKYKLMPTPVQEQMLDETLWACRTLYNSALDQRIYVWKTRGVSVSRFTQEAELKGLRDALPHYAAIHSHVLQGVLARLDKTYQAFFRRVKSGTKAGETPGFPRFQGRGRYHSFTYKEYGNGARLDNGFLILSKIGRIAVRWSRPIQGMPKTVTIAREADGWYVCLSCEGVPTQPLPLTGRETGIDVGVKVFLVTAHGLVIDNPRHVKRNERRVAKADKAVARCQKGSHGRKKAVARRAKAHQQVKRQRRDFQHKVALQLVRDNDVIYLEDLQVANLVRRPAPKPDGKGGFLPNGASRKAGLNKAIQDAGWYSFRTILTSKAAWAGKRVVAIPRRTPPRAVAAVGSGFPSRSVYGRMCVRPVGWSWTAMKMRRSTFCGPGRPVGG